MYEYLNRVRNSKQAIARIEEKLEELEALATKVTTHITGMPRGGNVNGTDEPWAILADYKTEYTGELQSFIRESQTLEEELKVIRNSDIRTAMLRRYVDCQGIDEIADRMHFDRSWVGKLLARGRKIYNAEYGNKEAE